jgi:hypothetical protein
MKPKKDPIKPSKLLTKKPNFKKEKLDDKYIDVNLSSLFRSPGVYTREVDISSWNVSEVTNFQEMFNDMEYFNRQLIRSLRVPPSFFNTEGPQRGAQQLQSQEDVARIFGELTHPESPIIQPSDYLGGGEGMMYNATTTMVLPSPKKKKSVWTRMKDYFSNIYKKWKRAE